MSMPNYCRKSQKARTSLEEAWLQQARKELLASQVDSKGFKESKRDSVIRKVPLAASLNAHLLDNNDAQPREGRQIILRNSLPGPNQSSSMTCPPSNSLSASLAKTRQRQSILSGGSASSKEVEGRLSLTRTVKAREEDRTQILKYLSNRQSTIGRIALQQATSEMPQQRFESLETDEAQQWRPQKPSNAAKVCSLDREPAPGKISLLPRESLSQACEASGSAGARRSLAWLIAMGEEPSTTAHLPNLPRTTFQSASQEEMMENLASRTISRRTSASDVTTLEDLTASIRHKPKIVKTERKDLPVQKKRLNYSFITPRTVSSNSKYDGDASSTTSSSISASTSSSKSSSFQKRQKSTSKSRAFFLADDTVYSERSSTRGPVRRPTPSQYSATNTKETTVSTARHPLQYTKSLQTKNVNKASVRVTPPPEVNPWTFVRSASPSSSEESRSRTVSVNSEELVSEKASGPKNGSLLELTRRMTFLRDEEKARKVDYDLEIDFKEQQNGGRKTFRKNPEKGASARSSSITSAGGRSDWDSKSTELRKMWLQDKEVRILRPSSKSTYKVEASDSKSSSLSDDADNERSKNSPMFGRASQYIEENEAASRAKHSRLLTMSVESVTSMRPFPHNSGKSSSKRASTARCSLIDRALRGA